MANKCRSLHATDSLGRSFLLSVSCDSKTLGWLDTGSSYEPEPQLRMALERFWTSGTSDSASEEAGGGSESVRIAEFHGDGVGSGDASEPPTAQYM